MSPIPAAPRRERRPLLGRVLLLACLLVPGPRDRARAAEGPSKPAAGGDLLLIAERLHLGDGRVLEPGAVWVKAGRIAAVGAPAQVEAEAGPEVPRRRAPEATPGLIDARSCLGLAGWLNTDHDKDEVDRSEPMQPELRALDAYNPDDPLIAWVRGFGVTTIHTGHAPRALISGQTLVVKTSAEGSWENGLLDPEAMISVTLGEHGLAGKQAGTRAKALALLRQALLDAEAYANEAALAAEQEDPAKLFKRDLRKECLARAVNGQVPLLVHAQRAHDIETARRLDREFPNLVLVLEGAAELPLLLEDFARDPMLLPVLLHPTMARPGGESEALSMGTARRLAEAGIPFALQSGYEDYVPRTRVVLFEAAVAARHGLSKGAALRAITLDAARILGIDGRVGSLEVGKDGDLALFDGDPFETTSHCLATYIEGRLVSAGERR
jgi:imidazolonepropionase-like amidohydrolase